MKKLIAICISICFLAGCSCFSPSKQKVSVMTSVDNAQIFANGEFVGTGRTTFKAKKNKDLQLMAKADGYYPAYMTIDHSLSATGILDIIGIFVWIIPFVGLLTPGSKTLDSDSVIMQLVPVEKK